MLAEKEKYHGKVQNKNMNTKEVGITNNAKGGCEVRVGDESVWQDSWRATIDMCLDKAGCKMMWKELVVKVVNLKAESEVHCEEAAIASKSNKVDALKQKWFLDCLAEVMMMVLVITSKYTSQNCHFAQKCEIQLPAEYLSDSSPFVTKA